MTRRYFIFAGSPIKTFPDGKEYLDVLAGPVYREAGEYPDEVEARTRARALAHKHECGNLRWPMGWRVVEAHPKQPEPTMGLPYSEWTAGAAMNDFYLDMLRSLW